MLQEERYDKILEILEEEEYVSVGKLSQTLFVSLPTVRRDLAELEKRELILRSHGGAKKLQSENTVIPFEFRRAVNAKEKRKLCEAALPLISDNQIIFIDASSSAMQLAYLLSSEQNLTVITNSIILCTVLSKRGIKNYCTGGEFQQKSMCFAGEIAENTVADFNFDIMFFSSHGVSDENVITDTSYKETMLRRRVMGRSKKTVFLCDSSKFGESAPYNLAPLDKLDYIVTDKSDLRLSPECHVKIILT